MAFLNAKFSTETNSTHCIINSNNIYNFDIINIKNRFHVFFLMLRYFIEYKLNII